MRNPVRKTTRYQTLTSGCEDDKISFLTVDSTKRKCVADNDKCCSFGQTSGTYLLSIQVSSSVLAASNIQLDEETGH